ncbi:nuclear transport factor 2 family protein [Amycolatopsis thermalba]|uniref:Nuclear transport factor 2 family protein n=1 Tax=Amycolatopsis thermalba TaxID=944492 RepID=A0ABY4P0J4_9PSEU|nr:MULTISPECIES: nuclear transport factor 2 family protein [Amycolatopsis]UQS25860.1 nuclear transport factor 2 family protein [Amycolatopsis thermalba]
MSATARHHIANLLHTYVEIADRKDVDAVVDLLGAARVVFPAARSADPGGARELFGRLWTDPAPHRHDVSNLIVEPAGDGLWSARAHYTRWVLRPDPELHTLGEYALLVAEDGWRVRSLTVTRTWTR